MCGGNESCQFFESFRIGKSRLEGIETVYLLVSLYEHKLVNLHFNSLLHLASSLVPVASSIIKRYNRVHHSSFNLCQVYRRV